jgi:hypothetical protein
MPIPLGLALAGAQAVAGLGQSLFSGRKRAERELDALGNKMPVYSGNKSINDFYQEAQNRYNENLLNNPVYLQSKQNADRVAATALGGLQGRGGASATAARLAGIQNEGLMGAAATAQQMKDQRFRELSGATGMKAADDRMIFQSGLEKFNRQDLLARQKAAAANARFDAGLKNIFGAAGNAALMAGDVKLGGGKAKSGFTEQPIASVKSITGMSTPSKLTIPADGRFTPSGSSNTILRLPDVKLSPLPEKMQSSLNESLYGKLTPPTEESQLSAEDLNLKAGTLATKVLQGLGNMTDSEFSKYRSKGDSSPLKAIFKVNGVDKYIDTDENSLINFLKLNPSATFIDYK